MRKEHIATKHLCNTNFLPRRGWAPITFFIFRPTCYKWSKGNVLKLKTKRSLHKLEFDKLSDLINMNATISAFLYQVYWNLLLVSYVSEIKITLIYNIIYYLNKKEPKVMSCSAYLICYDNFNMIHRSRLYSKFMLYIRYIYKDKNKTTHPIPSNSHPIVDCK